MIAVTVRPVGTINKDADPRYINNGDSMGAKNARSVTDKGGTSFLRECVAGGKYAFKPQPLSMQNNIYRIYFLSDILRYYFILVTDPNNNPLFGFNTAIITTPGNINQTLSDAISAISTDLNSTFQSFNISSTVVSANEGYVTLEITTVPMWRYIVRNNSGAPNHTDAKIVLVQQAIDYSLSGRWRLLKGYNMEGELIMWWTTQAKSPENIDIQSITNNSSNIQVTTVQKHGQASGSLVYLRNTGTDGEWIITVLSDYIFVLQGSTYSGGYTNGTVTVFPFGIGEIGRGVKDMQSGLWSYTRLMRSTQLNLISKKQIKAYCEKQASRKAYYFTDNYNPVRVVYDRTLNYQDDCLLEFVDSRNIYDYSFIGQQTQLFVTNTDVSFVFDQQLQSGGNIYGGNTYYAIRLSNEVGSETNWLPLGTGSPIPATTPSETSDWYKLTGVAPGVRTPKINTFTVSGKSLLLYKYIELAAVNRVGLSVIGEIVSRNIITGSSMSISHTGNETGTTFLDAGTTGIISDFYNKVLNIDSLNGRLILSNLSSEYPADLSGWIKTWRWEMVRKTTQPYTDYINDSGRVGGMQLSYNVHYSASYRINERYRFGIIAEFMDGNKTEVMWCADVVFNTDATQDRCDAALPALSLTSGYSPCSFGILFKFNPSDVVGGHVISSIVRRFYVMRVQSSNRQVVAMGYIIPSVSDSVAGSLGLGAGVQEYSWIDGSNMGGQYGEFPFPGGYDESAGGGLDIPVNYAYGSSAAPVNFTVQRRWCSFYSWDIQCGKASIVFKPGDKIINFGQYNPNKRAYADDNFNDYIYSCTGGTPTTPEEVDVSEVVYMSRGNISTVGGVTFSKRARFTYNYPNTNLYEAAPGYVIYGASDFNRITGFTENAVYIAQYVRPFIDGDAQFGNKENCFYVWTGFYADVTPSVTDTGEVYGGDVFTQQVYHKNRYPVTDDPLLNQKGFGQGVHYFSQNLDNFDMRYGNDVFPVPNGYAPQGWLNRITNDSDTGNDGYSLTRDSLYPPLVQNPDLIRKFPVRIAWSNLKQPESANDMFRVFAPLNFRDLSYSDGEITHHEVGNGELYTWQPLKFDRQYFDATTMFSTSSGAEIVLGDGAVMNRSPLQISQYGCSDYYGVVKGISNGGNDTFYWICKNKKAFLRFGYDGITDQGVIRGMDSFFSNNLNIVYDRNTPADNEGIHGVWNHRYKECIITSRAWRNDIAEWQSIEYNAGDVVMYGTSGFHEIPLFWISLVDENNTVPGTPWMWGAVPLDNPKYYNLFTIVYSEIKNGFDMEYGFMPRIYVPYMNTYLSPRPAGDISRMDEHNEGDYMTWYEDGDDALRDDGYWEGVVNIFPEESKSYFALRINSYTTPHRVEMRNQYYTYLESTDFELREGKYESPVKNDVLASAGGTNDEDTTMRMPGLYMRVKFFFKNGEYQNFFGITSRINIRPRTKKT